MERVGENKLQISPKSSTVEANEVSAVEKDTESSSRDFKKEAKEKNLSRAINFLQDLSKDDTRQPLVRKVWFLREKNISDGIIRAAFDSVYSGQQNEQVNNILERLQGLEMDDDRETQIKGAVIFLWSNTAQLK